MNLMEEPEKPDPPDSFKCLATSSETDERKLYPDQFRSIFFPETATEEWNNWRWQRANSLRRAEDFERILGLCPTERRAFDSGCLRLAAAVTPYYAGVIAADTTGRLRKTMVPSLNELAGEAGLPDPLAEDHDSPAPHLVHRYPDRALLLATDACFAYCRYCTRSRRVGKAAGGLGRLEPALAYIRAHSEIRDVIVSGGDPLTMRDSALDELLSALRSIPHVQIIRIGTKAPMVMPQRITPALAAILKKHNPVFVSIHCTHPAELTAECSRALEILADAGLPLGSQTVLLKDVNDDPAIMKELFHKLLMTRVRPYYLYHCDPVSGAEHFRTGVSKGLEIIENLRGHTSGYAVPQFVIDLPGGGGKIPVLPEYLTGKSCGMLTFRNYEGKNYTVRENGETHPAGGTSPEGEMIQ